jgi:hypothetical protein
MNTQLCQVPSIEKMNFEWNEMTYQPSAQGVLTYCIPRVHVSVTEEFMKSVLCEFFDKKTNEKYDCNQVNRVDFVEIEGNDNFKQAFVYHTAMTIQDKINHSKRMMKEGNEWRYAENPMLNIVSRITKNIFESEEKRTPLKVEFIHKKRQNYWLLLPNRNPLSLTQLEITEEIAEETEKLLNNLLMILNSNIALPKSFNTKVFENNKIETAWLPYKESLKQLFEKLHSVKVENEKIDIYIKQKHILTLEDYAIMEQFEKELDDEFDTSKDVCFM